MIKANYKNDENDNFYFIFFENDEIYEDDKVMNMDIMKMI